MSKFTSCKITRTLYFPERNATFRKHFYDSFVGIVLKNTVLHWKYQTQNDFHEVLHRIQFHCQKPHFALETTGHDKIISSSKNAAIFTDRRSRRLSVVDVGNNGNVSEIGACFWHFIGYNIRAANASPPVIDDCDWLTGGLAPSAALAKFSSPLAIASNQCYTATTVWDTAPARAGRIELENVDKSKESLRRTAIFYTTNRSENFWGGWKIIGVYKVTWLP